MRAVAAGLWVVDGPFSMLGMPMGVRMTVVRLQDGSLLLHAPIAIDGALAERLAALGPVGHLVAPNRMHHLFLADARRRYPDAKVHGPAGLRSRGASVALDCKLDGEPHPAWAGVLEQHRFRGAPRLDETVFFHPASRTLICTDVVFHYPRARGLLEGLVLRANLALGGLRQTRVLRSLVKDRDAARRSVEAIADWDFDRVVMAHGEVLESGGKAAFHDATAWLYREGSHVRPPASAGGARDLPATADQKR